ncbi:MAG: histidine--tRNA ligase [Candidatus Magasanikbacteria bacterium RIFOXYC2_FULL_39_8]|nr:MAG: histidine--tRNA ligase [Candidatus Magasanikbacteria bacterium RIFOXYC2_FULL_39_8]
MTTEKREKQPKGPAQLYTVLRGMKDILPKDGEMWQHIYHTAENIAAAYGFSYVETPVLEQSSLFIRSIGKGTDVVDKEMYTFDDRDGTKVCLRPEMTASVARAYMNHGLQTLPQPVKVWYWGQMFRHDRPQAGRYRQFHQFGCEILGEHSPVVDAELVVVAYNMLRDLGIETQVKVNSIGTLEDRQNYIVELVGYLRSKRSYLSEDSKKRINKNPLRILDSKLEQDIAVVEEAPQIIDWLSDTSKKFFMDVIEYLDEAGVPYVLTPTLVRGLDYYTDTVFELFADGQAEGSQSALGGGGRYNGLVAQLGGVDTPAAGFSLGIERIVSILRDREGAKEKAEENSIKQKPGGIFFAQLGDQARKRSLHLIEDLRREGIVLYHNLAKSSLKAQMEIANKLGVSHTLILGQKEVQDGTVLVRNMESGIQEVVDQKKVKNTIRKIRGV